MGPGGPFRFSFASCYPMGVLVSTERGVRKGKTVRATAQRNLVSTTFDTIGYWSELKLDIVRQYATAYSTILAAQKPPGFHHAYIDAFAGSGRHISKRTGEFVLGSPLNALAVHPPFKEYHLIDLDSNKIAALREATKGRPDVHVYEGDCNQILLDTVFSAVRYEDYRRALCLLDPYGLHLRW